jgi:hydrogenase/urease accessory protein HupE
VWGTSGSVAGHFFVGEAERLLLYRRMMKSLSIRSAASLLLLSATVAQAHPGHDGHEGGDFTWDLGHLAAHPLATLGGALVVGLAIWAGLSHLRARRLSAQSLRKSAAK